MTLSVVIDNTGRDIKYKRRQAPECGEYFYSKGSYLEILVTHSRWRNGGYLKCWRITEVVQMPTRVLEEKDRLF